MSHADKGWQADAAYVRCLRQAKADGLTSFSKVATRIYMQWADDTARGFQNAYQRNPLPTLRNFDVVDIPVGCCLVFADGLRFDVGQELAATLRARGLTAEVGWRWSALPSVTATAKPAVTPVAKSFEGRELGEDFAPATHPGGLSWRPCCAMRWRPMVLRSSNRPKPCRPRRSPAAGWRLAILTR